MLKSALQIRSASVALSLADNELDSLPGPQWEIFCDAIRYCQCDLNLKLVNVPKKKDQKIMVAFFAAIQDCKKLLKLDLEDNEFFGEKEK